MSKVGKAENYKEGNSVVLGNGYTAYVEQTTDGKRWVIRDANGSLLPNAPPNHKYLSDAQSYYNQHLKIKASTSHSTEKVDKKLEEAQKEIEEALATQKDLTEEQRSDLERQYNYLQTLNATARRTGRKARDIVLEWDSHPESRPEALQGINWNDKIFNYLYSMAGGDKNIEHLEDTIKHGQEARRDVVDNLYNLNREKEQSLADYLGLMTSENVGIPAYQTLWNTLTPDQQETITPDQLRMLQREQELSKGKAQSTQFANLFTSMAPQEGDIHMQWTDPSYGNVKSVWDQDFLPNYQYTSTGPYNQREHELAAAGHARGSSSIMGNAEARKNAIKLENIRAMRELQDLFRGGNQGNREIIDSLDSLSRAQRGAAFEPIKTEADIIGKDLQRQSDEAYRDNVFTKDIAQGEIRNINAEMQENTSLYNLLEQQRSQELQQYQGLANEIYQYAMLSQDIDKLSGEQKQQYAMLQEGLWQNRQQIIEFMKRAGREQEAWELQKVANDRNAFLEKVVLGGKIVATAAAIHFGQPQLAAAIWSPEIAGFVDSSKLPNWMGGSATAGNDKSQGGAYAS